MPRLIAVAFVLLVFAPAHGRTQTTAPVDPAKWDDEIRAFEARDRTAPPAAGGIVFTGSSSIRLWASLATDFPGLPLLNRGFGGSRLQEVTALVGRVVTPYKPRQVIVYCGGNDINAGRSASGVLADYQALVKAILAASPAARVAYISIAPNPARWSQIATVKAANAGIKAWTATDARLGYIDVYAAMLGADGQPKADIFVEDRLHMNPKGYAIWRAIVGPHLR
jgi:lysophospholipase L1-like esterase